MPLYTGDSEMCTLTNGEDPDEMPHDVAFHQGLHCLHRQRRSSEKKYNFYLEIVTCDFSIPRPPDKCAYLKIIFLISQPKHKLWVLKRTVSMRRFF